MSFWKNKIVLVTGGSAGLGWHIGHALGKSGARVVLAARNAKRLEEASAGLQADDMDIHSVAADVTDAAEVEQLLERVDRDHGRLDMLVNAAGRSARGLAAETTAEQFQDLWEVNFLGTVRCTQAALPRLIESRGGIVNIGSLACKAAGRYLGAYPASKFALAAYSQQLRMELAELGVHVLLVCPGPTERDDAGARYDEQSQGLPGSARQPGGGARVRRIRPDRLAAKVLVACQRRKPELIVPAKARLLFAISQFWPSLGDAILRRLS